MHELGSAFAAGLTQPGSMQAVLWDRGHWSQTYDAAGNRARIGRWDDAFDAAMFALMARAEAREGIGGEFVVELTATRSGDYVVSYSGDLPSLPPPGGFR